jgi:hypothetical protein
MDDKQESFDQWCIVELFGRQVIAGRVTEQVLGGGALLRVDVPETDGRPGFTRFYGQEAIYSITPVSEEAARLAVKRFQAEPVTVYVPELRQLAAANSHGPDWDDDDGDDEDEDF